MVQVWLTPDARGHKPQYGSTTFSLADRHNKLLHLLGGTGALHDTPRPLVLQRATPCFDG